MNKMIMFSHFATLNKWSTYRQVKQSENSYNVYRAVNVTDIFNQILCYCNLAVFAKTWNPGWAHMNFQASLLTGHHTWRMFLVNMKPCRHSFYLSTNILHAICFRTPAALTMPHIHRKKRGQAIHRDLLEGKVGHVLQSGISMSNRLHSAAVFFCAFLILEAERQRKACWVMKEAEKH
jgi:hypothetical protein